MQNTSVWMMPFCGGVKVFGEVLYDPDWSTDVSMHFCKEEKLRVMLQPAASCQRRTATCGHQVEILL